MRRPPRASFRGWARANRPALLHQLGVAQAGQAGIIGPYFVPGLQHSVIFRVACCGILVGIAPGWGICHSGPTAARCERYLQRHAAIRRWSMKALLVISLVLVGGCGIFEPASDEE